MGTQAQTNRLHSSVAEHKECQCFVYLKGQFICCLSNVSLNDVGSSNSRDVNGRFLVDQQVIPLVINLKQRAQGTVRQLRTSEEHLEASG